MQRVTGLAIGLAVAVLLVLAAASRVAAGRIDCARVVAEIDSITGRPGRHRADAGRLARKFGVDAAWIYKCAEVYGRRLSRPWLMREGLREGLEAQWETEEPDETGAEESGEDGQPLSPPPPDRRQLRRERPAPPTPRYEDDFNQGLF